MERREQGGKGKEREREEGSKGWQDNLSTSFLQRPKGLTLKDSRTKPWVTPQDSAPSQGQVPGAIFLIS